MNDVTSPHDPLCPSEGGVSCQCELIAQARADQNAKAANVFQWPAEFFEQLYRERNK